MRSKHFPDQLSSRLSSVTQDKVIMLIISVICCVAGSVLEMTFYGAVTGLVTAFFWMALWCSILILVCQFGSRALYVTLGIAIMLTILKIMI